MIRLALRVEREHAEIVLAELLELAPDGVEESERADGSVEYAVYGAPGELPSLPDLNALAGGALVEISTSELPDDWSERWKRFHRSVLIPAPQVPHAQARGAQPLPDLHVRPPWEPAADATDNGVREIVIDPGQAFGTGAHATTRLCLTLLLELAAGRRPEGPVLDVGTGSGVLAIAAALLGFQPVLALDNEAESVQAALANATVNGAAIDVRRFDLRNEPLPFPSLGSSPSDPAATVVLANLLRPLLLELAANMPHAPAHLIAGGLLAHEADEVAAAFAGRLGLRERNRLTGGEWAAVWLCRDRSEAST